MEKIEFKSQICTTREQSERLLALGLKRETADMHWCYHSVTATSYVVTHPYDGIGDWLPAWSLHRLLILLDKSDIVGTGVYINDMNVEECYEVVISRIANLLRIGAFDEDYLEEKKK